MNLSEIAKQLKDTDENIILIYAFNATGKTRLSVAYKDHTKAENNGTHAGVYYNAFSEDLFVWDNDEENNNENIRLDILYSSLNQFHSFLDVKDIEEKLAMYLPSYKFEFNLHDNTEKGIESITFFLDEENRTPIKISRGEERIFIWCFFLALFDVDAWSGTQDSHIFIDDPVSSLDEHNIFITAESIFGLIEEHYMKRRIIITTHHIGLFSILCDRLKKGEKSSRYKNLTKLFVLNKDDEKKVLNTPGNDVCLFHLHLVQTLDNAIGTELYAYHFVLLRQLLENISSFHGAPNISYTLSHIGIENVGNAAHMINALSHKNAYRLQFNKMSPDEEDVFKNVFEQIKVKYQFVY